MWTCLVAGLMPGTPQACIGSDVSVALVIEDDALDPETVRLEMPTSRRSQIWHNEMLAHCPGLGSKGSKEVSWHKAPSNTGYAVRTASSCCSKNGLVVKAVNNDGTVTSWAGLLLRPNLG